MDWEPSRCSKICHKGAKTQRPHKEKLILFPFVQLRALVSRGIGMHPSDEQFLRLNERLRLVPMERIIAARETQLRESRSPSAPRTLVDILREERALDAAAEDALRGLPDAAPAAHGPELLTDRTPATAVLEAPPEDKPVAAPAAPAARPAPPARARPLRPPDVEEADLDERNRFAHFVLLEEVGRGGMGTVYRAWDNVIGRIVALKILHTHDPRTLERFLREARIAGKLQHPHIAAIHEMGECGSIRYIALQYIDGRPIDHAPRTIPEALALVRDAARTLQHAHDQGILHRDIKPGNFLVDRSGRVYLTDFGAAKEVREGVDPTISLDSAIIGTPGYLSPEHAGGDLRQIDARSDVYCLGATLYKLLAGRPPFDNMNLWEAILAVRHRQPASLLSLNRAVSPELDAVVRRAMAKDPARRHPSAAAFADELDRLLREQRYTGRYGLLKLLARRWLPAAAAGVLLGLAAQLVVKALFVRPPPVTVADTSADLYAGAARALGVVETNYAAMSEEDRRARLGHDVFRRLAILSAREPGHLAARVLKARALYVDGDADAAARDLRALAGQHRRDYRIRHLSALLALDAALKDAPPWPAFEAPHPDWDGPVPDLPESLSGDFQAVAQAAIEPHLSDEYRRDGPAARALIPLAEGRWEEAADALAEVARGQPLPVYGRSWCRAAYLARRFREVSSSPLSNGLPERLGADLASAAGSGRPAALLEELLPACAGHPRARALVLAFLARAAAERGDDPAPYASAALDSLSDADPGARELRGVVLAARLRRLALSSQDDADLYQDALDPLGGSPATWMGRLAAIDVRLGLGARLARTGGDPRPRYEEVVALADALSTGSPSWPAPRILRAAARTRMGRHEDAWADLSGLVAGPGAEPRALLTAASVWLRFADERRRGGRPYGDEAARGREYALAVLGGFPEHPEAMNLAAAAALALAGAAAARGEDESELLNDALDRATRALDAVPRYADARVQRAAAHYLTGERERRNGRLAGPHHEKALADLDAALADAPGLTTARCIRGIVRFAMERYDGAADDWRQVLRETPDTDAGAKDIRAWLQTAERRVPR
jgi:hypothetical protein